ncbi:MAG: hypothetical protein OEV08_11355 [Nitrospira sp.]|nr:hypothetical protein [Nitrospira sp.]
MPTAVFVGQRFDRKEFFLLAKMMKLVCIAALLRAAASWNYAS